MVTKKRNITRKVAEAAREYTPRSRVRSGKVPAGSLGEALWNFFQTLPEAEQGVFARKLLADPEWYEDICDSIAVVEANKEPGRPFEEFEAELDAERAS